MRRRKEWNRTISTISEIHDFQIVLNRQTDAAILSPEHIGHSIHRWTILR